MLTVLYEKPFPVYAPIDLNHWQANMQSRIHAWYENTPQHENVSNRERRILDNFELTFHRALFFLHHPSPNIPEPPEESLWSMTDAAIKMIKLYRQFFRDHRLTIYWQAVENLSSAGTALMFGYVTSSRVREQLDLRALESLLNTCSSVLWGMVEHFPDFKGKRDAFDITASKILADLTQSKERPKDPIEATVNFTTEMGNDLMHQSNIESSSELPTTTGSDLGGLTTQTQAGQLPLPVAEFEPSTYTPQVDFSPSDFNDVSFDWEAFQNMNEFLVPTWT